MLITHSKITRTALIDLTDNSVIKSWAGNISGKVEIPGKGIKANLQRGQQWDNYRVVTHEVMRDEAPGMRRFQKLSETKRRYLKADNTLREVLVYSWIPEKAMKASDIRPTVIKVIPKPWSPLGTSLYRSFSRMPARQASARAQPTPLPSP